MDPLPPFAALRAFDAAARHLSFRDAASELGLTPTAISHQIRRLERDAGVKLFHRTTRAVALTDQGERFAREVSPALRRIEAGFAALQRCNERRVVVIGAGPVFLSRWLAPRLSSFAAAHPDIDLRLHTSPTEIWRRTDEFDIAVAWGGGNWPGVDASKLLDLGSTPLMAPALAERIGLPRTVSELSDAPLLHYGNATPWISWFAAKGLPPPTSEGATFDDANVMIHAALSGHGVMLSCPRLLKDDLTSGRLVQPFGEVATIDQAYFLLSPAAAHSAAATTVREWLRSQAPGDQRSTSIDAERA